MSFEAPLRLLRNHQMFGTITTYEYATPWADGKLIAVQKDQHDRCILISSFLDWIEAQSSDLSDEQYDQELSKRGLSQEDLQQWWTQWSVVTNDQEEHPVSLLRFYENGIIEWRW